jgi:hypothetical protein
MYHPQRVFSDASSEDWLVNVHASFPCPIGRTVGLSISRRAKKGIWQCDWPTGFFFRTWDFRTIDITHSKHYTPNNSADQTEFFFGRRVGATLSTNLFFFWWQYFLLLDRLNSRLGNLTVSSSSLCQYFSSINGARHAKDRRPRFIVVKEPTRLGIDALIIAVDRGFCSTTASTHGCDTGSLYSYITISEIS